MPAWLKRFEARLGLFGKIALVFAAAALLTVFIAATAWQSFRQVVDAQGGIIDEAMPAMDIAQKLARDNTRIIALMQQIGGAQEVTQVDRLQSALDEQLADMRALLYRLEIRNLAPHLSAALAATVESIDANLQRQSREAARRLRLGQDEKRLAAVQQQAALELLALAESLVANASTASAATISNLYPLIDGNSPKPLVFETLDRLIEVDVDGMERMSELQLTCFKLKTVLEQLASEENPAALDGLRHRFSETLAVLQRRLQDVGDPDRKALGQSRYRTLGGGLAAGGLFAMRQDLLAARELGQRLRTEGDLLAAQLNEQASALVTAGGQTLDAAGEKSRRAVDRGLGSFLFVAALLFLTFVVTLWALFRYHVLRRLQGMESAVRALSTGNYDVELATSDNDPLAPLGRALEQFRENALVRQRLEDELLRHQEALEGTVAARTMELQESNALLAREVAEHAVAREQAEEANRAKNIFLATLSHELRTPLSGVSGSVQLLGETALDARQREYIRMIGYANATLLEILEDMLSFSRLEAGKLDFEYAPFALRETIDNMLSLQGVPAHAKGLALIRDVADDVPEIVVGDRRKLNQILLNTIGNAIKFTDRGTVTVVVRCAAGAPDGSARLCFTVRDTGIGIPAEQCEAVFKPFVQVQSSAHRRHGGTGLGLAICQRLVEAMGGTIVMRSQPGQGSELVFCLDFAIGSPLECAPDAVTTPLLAGDHRLSVLVVEDDEINRIVCLRYLEALGHTACAAEDGEQALAMVQGRGAPFDAVLMDISLPGASGPEVAARLRTLEDGRWATLPIIAMSAHLSSKASGQYLAAGMSAFLGKPFDKAALAAALDRVCSGRGAVAPEAVGQEAEVNATGGRVALLDEVYLDAELEALGVALLGELLALFRTELAAALAEFERAAGAADWAALGRRAHRLRSAAGNLGLRAVIVATRELEDAVGLPAVDVAAVRAQIERLGRTASLSCAQLAQKLGA